jgi:TonB family protein
MAIAKVLTHSPYGAFELKRSYQKNMFTGTLISGSIPLLIIAVFFIVVSIQSFGNVPATLPLDKEKFKFRKIPSPRSFDVERGETSIDVKVNPPKLSVPNPVPDNQVIATNVVLSSHDREILSLKDLSPGDRGGSGEIRYDLSALIEELIPPSDSFISRTKDPVLIHTSVPVYPSIAQAAGIEGRVFMQVFVDTEGIVRDVRVTKSSGTNSGFDEAAEAAAWEQVYSPAMQNDQPVGVWIGYVVRFQLSN